MAANIGMGEIPREVPKASFEQREGSGKLKKLFLSLFTVGTYDIHQAANFRKEIKAQYHPPKSSETQEDRISVIRNSLLLLRTKTTTELRERVGISEDQNIRARVQNILTNLQSENAGIKNHAVKDGERLMHVLKSRANKKLGIEIVKTALKITSLVVAILLVFSPVSVILLSIFGGAIVVGVGVSAYRRKKLKAQLFILPTEIVMKPNAEKIEIAQKAKAAKDFSKAYNALREAYAKYENKFPVGFQKRLQELERDKFFEQAVTLYEKTISILSNVRFLEMYEREGLELLAQAIVRKEIEGKPEKKKKGQKEEIPLHDAPLNPNERAKLTEFLLYAHGNKELNVRLQALTEPSLAETFLSKFAFKTKEVDRFVKALEKVEKFLQTPPKILVKLENDMEVVSATYQTKVQAFTRAEKSPKALLQSLQKQIPDIAKLKGVHEKFKHIDKHMQEIEQIVADFSFVNPYDVDHFSNWEQSLKKALKAVDDTVKAILTDEAFQLPQAKKGKKIPEVQGLSKDQVLLLRKLKEKISDAHKDVKERIKSVERESEKIRKIHKDIQAAIVDVPKHLKEKFTLTEIYLLDSFKKLGETCPYHRSMPFLKELYEQCDRARVALEQLNCILQCSSGYKPGDITFLDEVYKAKFEGKPAFSEKGAWKRGALWKEIMKVPQKGPFTVQPFFTGSLTHTAIVNIQENMFTACEIIDKFANSDISFAEATYSKAFTPNFQKIVTPTGLAKMKELYPGKTVDEIYKELRFRFERTVSKLIHYERDRLKDIQLAHWKAGVAILPSLGKTPTRTIEQEIALQVDTQMFCSEFVASIMTSAFARVENDLLREHNLHHPFKFFQDIIPKNVRFEKVHPNRLENFLKAYFERAPIPPIVQALIQERS